MPERLGRFLVLIGSGEMATPMGRVHRALIRQLAGSRSPAALRAAIVDTPYGFQPNADALSAAALDYFGRRLGLSASVASLRRADGNRIAHATAAARVREADIVFSGPGSPSYALRVWSATELPQLFADKLADGGALVFASAAALTLGRLTVPVYEIYKAGDDPFWLPGLDLLSALGLDVAVIPHFDNREGTDHDTRFCFLGEERLNELERQLPDGVQILGIDEHTALVIDLNERRATVRGRGGVTIRRQGRSVVFGAGEELPLDRMRVPSNAATVAAAAPDRRPDSGRDAALRGALEQRDVDALVRIILATDDPGAARSMVVQLADVARGAIAEHTRMVEPLIDALVEQRRQARAGEDWVTADRIRDRLLEVGVELTDAADGSTKSRIVSSAD